MGTASEYFGAMVAEYDSLILRAVPRYQELIARLSAYLPDSMRRAVELGCGTGNYSLELVRRYPGLELTIVDASPEMLAATATRVAQAGGSVVSLESRFEELELEPGAYDLVTSCLSLHHVEDMAGLFRRLRPALAPGGHLVYGDQMGGGNARHSALNWGRMEAFWRRPGHLTDEEQRSLREHARLHDHYVSIVDQLRWLEQAGFRELDVVWRNWMWGIITARA